MRRMWATKPAQVAAQVAVPGSGRTGRRGAMTALAVVLALGACSTVEDSWDYVFGDEEPATVAAPADGAQPAPLSDGAEPAPAAPVPEGLRGDPNRPDYGPGQRRAPVSTRALNEQPESRRTVAESATPAASPAPVSPMVASPAPVQRAEIPPPPPAPAAAPAAVPAAQETVPLIPTTPQGEVFANAPSAAPAPQLRPPPAAVAGAAPKLLAPPVQRAGRSELMIAPPPEAVIGGPDAYGYGGGLDDLGTTVIGGDGRVIAQPGERLAHPTLTPDSFGFDVVTPQMPVAMTGAETLVATIQFAHGSAALSQRERRLLRQVVEMQRQTGGVLQVVGHASSRTADMSMDRHMAVNYTESARRAEAVAAALRRLGAPAEAVLTIAQSDNMPIYREVMPSGEAGNRRAEVYLLN